MKVLSKGKQIGLKINFHGDEIAPMKSAELAVKVGANAVCHCERISDEGIIEMSKYAKKNSEHPAVAVLLPTTAYICRFLSFNIKKKFYKKIILKLKKKKNGISTMQKINRFRSASCIINRF